MLAAAAFGLYPYVLPARNPEHGLTAFAAAAPRESLQSALYWWIPGMLLVAGYFSYIYSETAEKGFDRRRGIISTRDSVVGGGPFLHEPIAHRKQRWPDENSDESERQSPAQDAKEDQEERHGAALTDEPRFDDIVHAADPHAPDQHEDSPARRALMK